ncbi:MAG: hypothetical protein MI784_10925 [Cytophagales bacterium]|nr:hypothetical protein [Cytophagales bacterium]
MKFLYSAVFFLLISLAELWAQNGTVADIWTSPAAFTRDQPVTLYFDVTGTKVATPGATGSTLYCWFFKSSNNPNASNPKVPNGEWTNFNTGGKALTRVNGSNVYKITLTPTEFFEDGATMTEIAGLIRTGNGDPIYQTDNFDAENGQSIKFFNYTGLNNGSPISLAVPERFSSSRPISIVVNVRAAWGEGGGEQGQLVGQNVFIWLGANGFSDGSKFNSLLNAKAKCRKLSGYENLYQYDFVADTTISGWDTNPGVINQLNWLFNNGTWDKTARNVGGKDFSQDGIVDVFSQAFSVFPQEFTTLDLGLLTYTPSLDIPVAEEGETPLGQGILTGSINIYGQFYLNGSPYGDRVRFANNGDGTYSYYMIYRSEAFRTALGLASLDPSPNSLGIKFTNQQGAYITPEGDDPPFEINIKTP